MPSLYDEMECELYESVYGNHFTKWKYDCAVSMLDNKDGTKGAHWSSSDIISLAKSKGASFKGYNEYDFAYAMNMIYSDYYGAIDNTVEAYYRVALAFIEDKDAPEGKAYRYYKAMKH